ncbi:diphthamide biosynthesis enzyme Dph2 [Haloferax mediterranei ATCC 33500]|uniref:2-(3-amino-3-carboxypropyl)histidine synthase n=2 Tax=Haloferax mediterranei (strain ATCC 33500 / DSM 1411 / JCM 8866 / NBRC 14739 / NCIMB 2177 / R-4) TaxID=523841 RepID=I3R5B3_HALMT|nr:diphthamide biosynthesis enzyme Dph2 [Haloferax mediterranei]AFK19423.1 diphthamide synthase subunit DPH2 [Haloferax mediterranei ATCC 33500]AHZ21226.1 diphthamide biosynthesis protein [Haloferax mediterranei ATCC 33500]MDX5989528.1 diphthamide biosynthesis enzyme Dph2 [Haloferax mediterranei ATCC 33500]QCQ75885.1 diphthamide biosynthesis enzyme Dph2 [Haloferax mediterranei ATCC 33500]
MSQDASSEGDLRNTGMSLKHDREWDYELERIVEAIEERDAKRVGLQFPEGLKRRGPAVADDLRQLCDDDVTFMLSGQPCYGACDLDTYLMRRTDVFAHFGHSPMKESDKIIYVPLFSNVDPFPIMEDALDELEGDEVGLVTTAQHMNRFEDMCDWLEERGYTVQTRKGDDRLTYEGQVLGCNYASADIPADNVLYVGGGKFHPLGLAMEHPEKNVVIADPVNNVVTIADTRKFMKQRYASVHKAMDAEKWGVIFCTKIGQGRMEIAEKILEDNENAYLITMDEVTPDRLRNFDMDAFVNTGCPRITTDDGPRFHKPMLTPQEYRIAVGDEPLDSLEFDTFHGTW